MGRVLLFAGLSGVCAADDPMLDYLTILNDATTYRMVRDATGNLYVAGITVSALFSATTGAVQTTLCNCHVSGPLCFVPATPATHLNTLLSRVRASAPSSTDSSPARVA